MSRVINKKPRGFAAMAPERIREIAAFGGRSVPPGKRQFTKNKALASQAGKAGGRKRKLGCVETKILTVRLPSPWIEQIDQWRRKQKVIPSYSAFLREAVQEKLSRLGSESPEG